MSTSKIKQLEAQLTVLQAENGELKRRLLMEEELHSATESGLSHAAVENAELREQLTLMQNEQCEWMCHICKTIHPTQRKGRLVQPCPSCGEAMLPTSFNLRHIVELREQLEVERMRLAACGTAALGYFNGCADQYKSASLADVLRLREQLDQQIVANAALTGENSELFCKLAAAQAETIEQARFVGMGAEREAALLGKVEMLERKLAAAQKDVERLNAIRELCGYAEDGSSETVRIGQDDATRDWIISVGGTPSKRWYYGPGFRSAIDAAIAKEKAE